LLEGKNVNLRVMEKEDVPLLAEWFNNPDFSGEYNPLEQESRTEIEKKFNDLKSSIIEKKDGSKIGSIGHFATAEKLLEIGFSVIPPERGKGYCTEAVKILVDYIFLSRDVMRLQARTDVRNVAAQKVLENAEFTKEGIVRKSIFIRGEWRDMFLYSILREAWKEPKILTKTTSQVRSP